jgi:5'-3' exonuclease
MPKFNVELVRYTYHISEPFEIEADDVIEARRVALDMGNKHDEGLVWDEDFDWSQCTDMDIQHIEKIEEEEGKDNE